ncbi:MAG: DM13 domain-containing protein [Chloroflexi bacterium]|nr:DM13 domain-containing protein [Chloroflexota bacterium]
MNRRALLIAIGLIVVVVGGAGAWWLGSPLFINTVVEEELPFEIPTAAEMDEMSEDEREKVAADVMDAAAKMPDKEMEEDMPEMANDAQPVVVAEGQFQDADEFHKGTGTVTLYRLADGTHLLRFEDFRVTNGPQLHVLLANHADPVNRADLEEGYIDLGGLKGNVGSQNYEIAADIAIDPINSIVIYCKPFHVVFSTAALSSGS